jgi:transposase-like protein
VIEQTSTAKEAFWRRTIVEQVASGLSVQDFCRQHQLQPHSFYSWKREIRLRDQARDTSGPAATFVPVKLVDSPQSHARQAAVCIQLPGGIVVQIYAEDR